MSKELQVSPQIPLSGARAKRISKYVRNSKAGGTQRVYASHWADFEEFCRWRGYTAMPAAPQIVCDYLAELADAGKSVNTLQVKLAAIAFQHKGAKLPDPCASVEVKTTIAGIRRTVGTRPKRKAPLTIREIRMLAASIPPNLRGLRDLAVLLIGYAGAFRRAELVAVTVADVTAYPDHIVVLVPFSKTDQEGKGKTKTIARLNGDNAGVCPVRALEAWLSAANIESGHVFRGIDRHDRVHGSLNDREVARIVKRRALAAGLDPDRLGGHSLRAGFVTQNALAGTPDWKIAEQTGHKPGSRVLQDYIRAAGKGAMDASRAAFGDS